MKKLPIYLSLLLLLTCAKDSTEDNLEDSKEVIDASNDIPEQSPVSQYKTSLQNHEWNDGWYSHTDVNSTGLQAMGSLTYFDYGNDGDMDGDGIKELMIESNFHKNGSFDTGPLDSDFNGFQLNENGKFERKMFN